MRLNEETCWRAVTTRDRLQDGRFVFGVTTTGIFCRPSCPSRRANRANVRFFETSGAAQAAGFRACKRCRPLEIANVDAREAARIKAACDYIRAHADERVTLAALASKAGLSRFHFQRTFKAAVGLTPKQYADACRVERLKGELRTTSSVTDAVYASGFGSSSRVYEHADNRLGMTPAAYGSGGRGLTISCASVATPLGRLMVGATDRGVCFVQFGASHTALRDALAAEFPQAEISVLRKPYSRQFTAWMRAVLKHLKGVPDRREVPLDVRATAFQMQVWRYLQSVPAGEVRSYATVARDVGRPSAARAVARACASNTVAMLIPCHRVIRGDGELGGYRWGLDRKRALLTMEKAWSGA
jgi:AraC family transcriptional regulator, regulatory protein of adaptative response / methylated-DNA-[protein]-cysteine methyltransferase